MKKRPTHQNVLYISGVPKLVKANFKAAVARKGKTMREVVIDLMVCYAEGADRR